MLTHDKLTVGLKVRLRHVVDDTPASPGATGIYAEKGATGVVEMVLPKNDDLIALIRFDDHNITLDDWSNQALIYSRDDDDDYAYVFSLDDFEVISG